MHPSIKSVVSPVLRGIAWCFFIAAGISFWFGGGVIAAVAQTDRGTGEIGGMVLMILFAIVGGAAKFAEDRLDEGDGPTSLGEALRKLKG